MKQRGRKSAAEAEIPRIGGDRPEPPDDLAEPEKVLWTRIADCKPPDWFTQDTHETLRSYCRTVSYVRQIEEWAEQARLADKQEEFMKLMRAREGALAKQYAAERSMRITQQSMYDAAAAHRQTKPRYKRPWEQ